MAVAVKPTGGDHTTVTVPLVGIEPEFATATAYVTPACPCVKLPECRIVIVRSEPSCWTITAQGLDAIPLATTSRIEGPDSIDCGTSNWVDTGVVPVATPIVL